jgi:transcriptional regulator NrdR family protein
MPQFEVRYAFLCTHCGRANTDVREFFERNDEEAMRHIRKYVECSQCRARLTRGQAVASAIRIIGSS